MWPSGKVQQKARLLCHPGQTACEARAKPTLLICVQESSNPQMAALGAMAAMLWYRLLQRKLTASTDYHTLQIRVLNNKCHRWSVHRVKSMGGLRQLHRAQNGGPGGNQKKVGRHGADKVIQVCSLLIFIAAVLLFPQWSCCMLSSSHRRATGYDVIDIQQLIYSRRSSTACLIHTLQTRKIRLVYALHLDFKSNGFCLVYLREHGLCKLTAP